MHLFYFLIMRCVNVNCTLVIMLIKNCNMFFSFVLDNTLKGICDVRLVKRNFLRAPSPNS